MAELKSLLSQAAGITHSKIAVLKQGETLVYPECCDIGITYEEACEKAGKNYKGFNIYMSDASSNKFFLCISAGKYYESEASNLVMLLVRSAIEGDDSHTVYLKKAIEGNYDAVGLVKLEDVLKHYLPGYLLLVDGYRDSEDDIFEILANSMDISLKLRYDGRIVAVAREENIEQACSSFIKNVLSELLIECRVAIGGNTAKASELKDLYDNCIEALYLRRIYGLGDSVVDYYSMYGYRIAYSLDPKLKEFIMNRAFTSEFKEMANSELGITIEEFFRNNLNLTDTAGKLYIHRNTLLYRLDKIHKATGFDLKRFEDSWLFKLAWMIYKERSV